jgi:hypothetical protein
MGIQVTKMRRIHANPDLDPQYWSKRVQNCRVYPVCKYGKPILIITLGLGEGKPVWYSVAELADTSEMSLNYQVPGFVRIPKHKHSLCLLYLKSGFRRAKSWHKISRKKVKKVRELKLP